MQDIQGKEAELGNAVVDGAVRKAFVFLNPADKTPQFVPGNVFGPLMQDVGEILEISADVGGIRFHGMFRKAAEGDHLPELNKIIVHNRTSQK